MNKIYKRTKILATVGPATFGAEKIEELIKAGVNGCRLNFSHGDYAEKDEQINWIREASKKAGKPVAIIQDLQGPKIRLGVIKDNHLDLHEGDEVVLDYALAEHDGGLTLPIQYNLAEKVRVGEPMFLFDGKVEAEVAEVISETAIKIKVKNNGYVMSKKGVNLPETDFGGDTLTEKDLADIEFGASRDFDYVAISFVQSAQDIENLRQILLSYGSDAQIIAKIETKAAVKDDETMIGIVQAADGVMVARGDMAYEVGVEKVPVVQRKLVNLCRKNGKLVIIATQVMASMVDNPAPTRAEANDVATAVIQGADVVMLSDETTNGQYPIETVRAVRKIIKYVQDNCAVEELDASVQRGSEKLDAISEAAVELAERLGLDAIVCETGTGVTTATVAANRPNLLIISVTDNERVANQLTLCYANHSYVRPYSETYGYDLVKELKANGVLGDQEAVKVVIVSGRHRSDVGGSDTLQLRTIKG